MDMLWVAWTFVRQPYQTKFTAGPQFLILPVAAKVRPILPMVPLSMARGTMLIRSAQDYNGLQILLIFCPSWKLIMSMRWMCHCCPLNYPPVDLYLIFEKSSCKNQVRHTALKCQMMLTFSGQHLLFSMNPWIFNRGLPTPHRKKMVISHLSAVGIHIY